MKYSIISANAVSAENGERWVAKLAQRTVQDSPTASQERQLQRFLRMEVAKPIEFSRQPPTPTQLKTTKLSPEVSAVLLTLTTYIAANQPGSLTVRKICAAAPVPYELVLAKVGKGKTLNEALAEAISHNPMELISNMAETVYEHYPSFKQEPSIQALMKQYPELRRRLNFPKGSEGPPGAARAVKKPPPRPPNEPTPPPDPDGWPFGSASGSGGRRPAARNGCQISPRALSNLKPMTPGTD